MQAFRFWNQIETPLNNTKHDPINDSWIDNFVSLTNHHEQQQQLAHQLVEFDSNYPYLLSDEDLLFRQKNWSINPQKIEYFDIPPHYMKNQIPQEYQHQHQQQQYQQQHEQYQQQLHQQQYQQEQQQQLDQQQQQHQFYHSEIKEEAANLSSNDMHSISQAETNDLLLSHTGSFMSDNHKQNVVKLENFSHKMEIPKVSAIKKFNKKNKEKKKIKNNRRISERLKNIVKNYGKNCATFSISELGAQYINEKLTSEQISKFKEWIRIKIPSITNIKNLREMLLILPNDDIEITRFKQTFQYASEIFIKNYSFNWVFHSPRINDKKGHIFARFKMLRRIQDPKSFTYIH